MSADNGYIVRKNQNGELCLQMYFASNDEYPPIKDTPKNMRFLSLQSLVKYYEANCEAEYGLSFRIRDITYDHEHKLEWWGGNAYRCAVTNCTYWITRRSQELKDVRD